MSSRSLIGGNLNLNSLTVKHLTVTDTSNNDTEFGNIECIGIEATDKVRCPVFECPTSDYDSTNISEPKCSNGITIGTKDSNGLTYEANLQINSWNSSGFVDTDSKKCNLTINHRSGNLQTKGDISGHTATFETINVSTLNVLNSDVSNPDENLTVNSITAESGNISNLTSDDIISTSSITGNSLTVPTGNISNLTSDNITSTSITGNSITAETGNITNLTSVDITVDEILKVSNNAMILNNAKLDSQIPLLGNDAIETGAYLTKLSPDSTSSYTLEQLAAGDNGSQSIILTAGGSYGASKNTIQSYDTSRQDPSPLYINPLGGEVIVNNLKPVNQMMGAACYMIKPDFGCSTFICTIRQLSSDLNVSNDQDLDLLWCVNPGFKIIVYIDSDFNGDYSEFDNSNGIVPIYETGLQDATSIQVFYFGVEINPFNF